MFCPSLRNCLPDKRLRCCCNGLMDHTPRFGDSKRLFSSIPTLWAVVKASYCVLRCAGAADSVEMPSSGTLRHVRHSHRPRRRLVIRRRRRVELCQRNPLPGPTPRSRNGPLLLLDEDVSCTTGEVFAEGPGGYVDGMGLYEFVGSNPCAALLAPSGLVLRVRVPGTTTIDSGDARRPKLCRPSSSEPALPVILSGAKNLSRDGRATSSQALVHAGTTARKILRCFAPQNDGK